MGGLWRRPTVRDTEKLCYCCKQWLLYSKYNRCNNTKATSTGYMGICKECRSQDRKQNRERENAYKRRYRHKIGKSILYRHEIVGKSSKFHSQRRYKMLKAGGKLSVKRIQMVYEDNIKKYGTLTCYLCEEPILFGKDTLEHKFPLSRGGTNEYHNLAIAHKLCNCRKGKKTVEEYKGKA